MLNHRVLVITGAGVSAESGIPTFRGPGGYWRNLDPSKLATPEAFARDPELVWEWYRERRQMIRTARPNPAHQTIARLGAALPEFLLVTQNVDDLHARAQWEGRSLPPEKMLQIHGEIFVTRCSRCDFEFREENQDGKGLPVCERCGSLMRPGVVWFGESLDPVKMSLVEAFLEAGPIDLVMVAGTTALFGYILDWALRAKGEQGRLVEVNPEQTSLSPYATQSIREPAGRALPGIVAEILGSTKSVR